MSIRVRVGTAAALALALAACGGEGEGGAPRVAPPPPPGGVAAGDRRTGVTADGTIESPRFRVRRPEVREGLTSVVIRGESLVESFTVSLYRGDELLGVELVTARGPAGAAWKAWEATVPVVGEGGLREGDAVVIATGGGEDDREIIFQPIRN